MKPLLDSGDPENVYAFIYFSGHGCSDDKQYFVVNEKNP